jgi:hypothetical protein
MSRDGSVLVVRTYVAAYLWHVRSGHVAAALRNRPRIVGLPLQRQGEGICIAGASMYLDSEGRDQPVWRVPLPDQFREPISLVPPAVRRPSPRPSASATASGTSAPVLVVAGALLLVVAVLVALRTFRSRRRE